MKTYGRLLYGTVEGKQMWGIDRLVPHVAIAFKRLFPRASPTAERHLLTDTDEVRADIRWFISRYALDAKPICMTMLEEGHNRLAERLADREAILDLKWTPGDVPAAFRSGLKPYLYQSQAAEICLRNPSLLLGDDVGLGKTITTFAVAASSGCPLPMAIVVQPHLVRQWEAKVREFTTMRVHAIRSSTPYNVPPADIYVFSYNMISGWIDLFREKMFKSVAYDEIQELRTGTGTNKGTAAWALSNNTELHLGLTATPVYNYGGEIWHVMQHIQKDLLGTWEEFIREWCKEERQVRDPDALGAFLVESGYFLRRREDDAVVDRSMPPPNILDYQLPFDEQAWSKEEDLLRVLATTVLNGRFHEAGAAARDLDVKMRHLTGVTKAKAVAAYVDMLLQDRERVLLAGWHRDVYAKWDYALRKYDPVLYTGSESKAAKDRNVQRFMQGSSRVLMISLRSGAGLDGLQYGCRDVVFGELDWSPQVHYQLIGRVRRPGQQHQVTGHYLHVDGGSDPVLMSMLGVKSDQSRGIMDPGKAIRQHANDESRVKKLAQFVLEKVA